jgi:ATP-dependent HslUV protease ATP-binding subunit HslU
METEGVTLEFHDEAIHELSRIAAEVNTRTENIGARRLHTIMELLLEEVSFNGPDLAGQTIPITKEYVTQRLADVVGGSGSQPVHPLKEGVRTPMIISRGEG